MHSFTFNGQTSTDFGIGIEKFRPLNRPARKYDVASVAGRNGNVYDLKDVWDEVSVSYEIWAAKTSNEDLHAVFTNIMEWLNSADGYAELTDTYDTEHYRLAVFVDSTDIENSWNTKGRAVITFRCRPERFLTNQEITSTSLSISVTNSTAHDAKPFLTLTGGGIDSILKPAGERSATFSKSDVYYLEPFAGVSGYDWDDTVYLATGFNARPSVNSSSYVTYSASGDDLTVTCYNSLNGVGLPVRVLPNQSYMFTCTISNACYITFYLFDETGIKLGWKKLYYTSATSVSYQFDMPNGAAYVFISFMPSAVETATTWSDIFIYPGTETQTVNSYGTNSTNTVIRFTTDNSAKSIIISQSFDTLYVDCENERVYSDDMSYDTYATATEDSDWATRVVSDSFPRLPAGETTTITLGSAITQAVIDPRFWEV